MVSSMWRAALVLSICSCTPAPGRLPTPLHCDRQVSTFDLGAELGALEGTYALVVVAEKGDQAGRRVSGHLNLRRTSAVQVDTALGSIESAHSWPVWGWTDAPLETLGAVMIYPAQSDSPLTPGVLAWHDEESRHLQLTIGQRFELTIGVVLKVTAGSTSSFSGTWSNPGIEPVRSGRFCAVREPGGVDARE